MTYALLIGCSFGAIIGLIHAGYVYERRTSEIHKNLIEHPVAVRVSAAYFALWTFFLWVLFGSYVFYMWVISIVIYVIYIVLKSFLNIHPSCQKP